jgi:hypothetical protein
MGRGDELDKSVASRFAWRWVKPGETVDLSDDLTDRTGAAETEPPPGSQGKLEAVIEQGHREWHALAEDIARVWAMSDPAAQARGTAKLARRAAKMGLTLAASQDDPLEAVRMVRLFVRHFARLSRAARDEAENACLWVDLSHPEANDLVLEIARAGNERIGSALTLDPERMETIRPDLSSELAKLLEEAKSWSSRVLALDWLTVFGERDAVPAARRALRLPHMGVRLRAIQFLLGLAPPALTEGDVRLLLEDAVLYGAPFNLADDSYETASQYASALLDAIAAVRPTGGEDSLLAITEGYETPYGDDSMLDEAWALEALAAAYADNALPLIDEALDSTRAYERVRALDAVARLPIEMARPRLLRAAADGAPGVATRAKEIWLDREGRPCPVDEMAGVPIELLRGAPPSDRMRSRLIVLRGASTEARHTMLDVLLREAPDAEALALLVFCLGDDDLSRGTTRKRLPQDTKSWARTLVRRFGAPAVEGLCALATHYPGASMGTSWLQTCADLLEDGSIRLRDAGPLQREAVRQLASEAWDGSPEPAKILAQTGVPPELLERLWSIVVDGEYDVYEAMAVERLLVDWRGDGAVDARLVEAMEAALAGPDFDLFDRVAPIAFKRSSPGALDIAERMLAHADDEEAVTAVALAGRALLEAERLPSSWVEMGLTRPDTTRFTIATRLMARNLSSKGRATLEAALASPAREGAAAVEAAEALLFAEPPLRPNDPRLFAILARAAPHPRAELISTMLALNARLAPLEPHIAELLASTDSYVIDSLREGLWGMAPRTELLRRIVSKVADADVRAEIEEVIGPDAPYWQDGA